MDILLDGNDIIDKVTLYQVLKRQLNAPEFYGNNLDALWDVLNMYPNKIDINLINLTSLISHLGAYAQSLIDLLNEVSEVNTNIVINIR